MWLGWRGDIRSGAPTAGAPGWGTRRAWKRKVLRSLARAQEDRWRRGIARPLTARSFVATLLRMTVLAEGDVSDEEPAGAGDYRAEGNQMKLSAAMATIPMIMSTGEADGAVAY